jgi:hypothetical protein
MLMTQLNYSRIEDVPPFGDQEPGPVGIAPMLGSWISTNPYGQGIKEFVISRKNDQAYLQIYGTGRPEPIDWGETPISAIYGKDVCSSEPMAFEAQYDLGFMHVHMQGNFSLGLIVLACFNVFTDNSGRSNYFSREFFRRQK